jgi:hypothetical protein
MSAASPFEVSLPDLPLSLLTIGAPKNREATNVLALTQVIEDTAVAINEYAAVIGDEMGKIRQHFANAESVSELTDTITILIDAERNIAEKARVIFEEIAKWEAGAPARPRGITKSLSDLMTHTREAMVSVLEQFRDTRLALEIQRARLLNAEAGEGAAVAMDTDEDLDRLFDGARK